MDAIDPHKDSSSRRGIGAAGRILLLLVLVGALVAIVLLVLDAPPEADRLPADEAALVVATDIAVESFEEGKAIDAAWLARMRVSDASIVQQTTEPVPDGRVYVRVDDPITVVLTTWIKGRRRDERLRVVNDHLVPVRLLGSGVPKGSVPGVPKTR